MYDHFSIERLADGVYAAIAAPDGGAGSNAGIVSLGDRTLVFDTFATVSAARELRAAAEALTGRPVTHVINSHDHPDHVHGNVLFAHDACLIASQITRGGMAATGLERMHRFRQQIEQGLAHATDPQQRRMLRAFLDGYPAPDQYRLPHLAFADELRFHGGGRTARLVACGAGHSPDDAVLFLPEEGILFSGDLVTDSDLVFRYGDPENWLRILDRLEALEPKVVVPGHGRVLPGGEALRRVRQYIREMLQTAEGLAEEAVAALPVPEGHGEHWYSDNLLTLVRRRLR